MLVLVLCFGRAGTRELWCENFIAEYILVCATHSIDQLGLLLRLGATFGKYYGPPGRPGPHFFLIVVIVEDDVRLIAAVSPFGGSETLFTGLCVE